VNKRAYLLYTKQREREHHVCGKS